MPILSFLVLFLMAKKVLFIPFTVYIYAFHLAFSSILHYVLQHFTLHLAPKRTAFSTKTQCIQHQNTLHLAPKYTAFSTKTHRIQQQTAKIRVKMASYPNKYSFRCIHILTAFCIKTNLRENRLFAARWAIGDQKGHSEC